MTISALHGLHGPGCDWVGVEVRGLWVTSEGDGLCRWGVAVEGVPDLFSDEGHEGAEQAQGALEDACERGESDGGGWVG